MLAATCRGSFIHAASVAPFAFGAGCFALVHHLARDDGVQPENVFVRQSLLRRLLLDMTERRKIIQHLASRAHRCSHGRSLLQRADFLQRERIALDGG